MIYQMQQQGDPPDPDKDEPEDEGDLGHSDKPPGDDLGDAVPAEDDAEIIPLADPDPDDAAT